jgi:hypothetical protein
MVSKIYSKSCHELVGQLWTSVRPVHHEAQSQCWCRSMTCLVPQLLCTAWRLPPLTQGSGPGTRFLLHDKQFLISFQWFSSVCLSIDWMTLCLNRNRKSMKCLVCPMSIGTENFPSYTCRTGVEN